MVQILPQEQTLGSLLGAGLGAGVQTGLTGLMDTFLKEKIQERQMKRLSESLGFTPQQASLPINETQTPSLNISQGQSPQMSNIERIATNPEAMTRLEVINPQMANMVQKMYETGLKQKELTQKHEYEQTKLASAESKDYKTRIDEIQSSLPDKRMALYRIKDALQSKDIKSTQNFIADYLESKGLPGDYARTSSGAALQSAVKEFLMGDIARIKGGRPNQFIEKQLASAYPKAGYDKIANQKILKAMETGTEIAQKEADIYNKISDEYEAKGKHIPGNISKLVNNELKAFVKQKEDELQKYYQSLNKPSKKQSNTEYFNIEGKAYNIPKHLVPTFKKEMGIK